jgi:hypothetical protein
MGGLLFFFPWQDAEKAPEVCPLCQQEPPIFEYRLTPEPATGAQSQELHGYCCLRCGQQLLATMAELTLTRWAEESSPKRDDKKTVE